MHILKARLLMTAAYCMLQQSTFAALHCAQYEHSPSLMVSIISVGGVEIKRNTTYNHHKPAFGIIMQATRYTANNVFLRLDGSKMEEVERLNDMTISFDATTNEMHTLAL
jgi:hypothetical protein